jgi:hypothetical protein
MNEINIDYSEVYRTQEMKQLNKRLKKTQNILFLCAFINLSGGIFFWVTKQEFFNLNSFIPYMFLTAILMFLGFISKKKPYMSLLTALIICLAFWTLEIVLNLADEVLIEGIIQKLIIVSVLVSSIHVSREAELIRKELHFS